MLLELTITDFAIIEQSTIRFDPGLNVLTGETGAGKSILLDALGAVLGQRVSSDLVRTGARAARIEAAFVIEDDQGARIAPVLDEIGVESSGEELILTREVLASGRSTARVNGRMTTATQLNQIGSVLVDIHGQSEHLSLLRTTEQRGILDRFAGLDDEREQVGSLARDLRAIRIQIQGLSTNVQERERRLDLLRFQVQEIEAAALAPGEDEALQQERELLLHTDRLRQEAFQAIALLSGDDAGTGAEGVTTWLRTVEHAAVAIGEIDREAIGLSERATELVVLAEDLGRDLRSYADAIEADPERLSIVEDRLSLIQSLRRKYGATIEDIIAFGEDAQAQLNELTGDAFDIDALTRQEEQTANSLSAAAVALSAKRREAADRLARQVEQSIADLRMGRAEFAVAVEHRPDPNGITIGPDIVVRFDESGIDDVEFLIAPNSGAQLRPLARIASGGETARLMLALKSILSEVDATPTLIFDEIDVGVGGRAGQVVGEKLWSLSAGHQVVVVTHLAQIAAFADVHMRITKRESDSRVVSVVEELSDGARLEEIAAMLDGVPVTPAAIANAQNMIDRARQFRDISTARPVAQT